MIALFPVLGFFDIFYHQHSFVADHFQYLALIALIALCVHVASFGLDRIRLPWIGAAAGRTSYGGRTIAAYEVSAPPSTLRKNGDRQPATIRAAVTDKYMLIASGMHSKENICRLIDAAAQPPQSPAAKSPHFCKAMAEAPENAAGVAYFSITSFLNWANRSGVPGTENLPVPEPGDGVAAWFVPADAGFVVQLRFPAAELAELRAALFGNTALLDLPL